MIIFLQILAIGLTQPLYYWAGAEFSTLDGNGYISNKVDNLTINEEPFHPFQNIVQNQQSTIITITNSLLNSTGGQCKPTIYFTKFKRLVGSTSLLRLNISVNHSLLSDNGNFSFQILFNFSKQLNQRDTIIIYLTKTKNSSCGQNTSISNQTFSTNNNKSFCVNSISNSSFNGSLDITAFLNSLLQRKLLQQNSILRSISIQGDFYSGSYQTDLNYSIEYSTLFFLDAGQLQINSNPFVYFLKKSYNESNNIYAFTDIINPLTAKIWFSKTISDNSTQTFDFGKRFGSFFGFKGLQFDYFPLKPTLQIAYLMSLKNSSLCYISCRSSICIIISLRNDFNETLDAFQQMTDKVTRQIQICSSTFSKLQQPSIFIKTFTYFSNGTESIFSYFNRSNQTQKEPSQYLFVTNNSIDSVDIFFFVDILLKAGSIQPTKERIFQISSWVKIHFGQGLFWFSQQNYPSLTQIKCNNTLKYFNGKQCVPCEISGCIKCTNSLLCAQCQTQLNWVLDGSTCLCLVGYYQKGLDQNAQCVVCSQEGCMNCLNQSFCILCNTSSNWVIMNSKCVCQFGYCQNGTGKQAVCIQSIPLSGCLTCINSKMCTKCDSMLDWILSQNICKCRFGYYQLGIKTEAKCMSCIEGCLQCDNSQTCITCNSSQNWALNTQTEICSCQQSFYKYTNQSSVGCNKCQDGCLYCLNNTYCNDCNVKLNWILVNHSCVCKDSFYLNVNNNQSICSACLKGCTKCQNLQNCLQCNTSLNLIQTNLTCKCKDGFYMNKSLNSLNCIACSMTGCLLCQNAGTCLSCNYTANFIIRQGNCNCAPGYSLNSSAKELVCSFILQIKKSIGCLFMEGNVTLENCLNSPPSPKTQVIMGATSTPNLGMILKISQLINLVDDFTFYTYHNITYSKNFDLFIHFMWNLTAQKWIPSQVSQFYYQIQDSYQQKIKLKSTFMIPKQWKDLGEDSSFVRNTRDYWIGSIPLSIIIFFIPHLVYRILAYFKSSLQFKILNFKWWSILLFTVLVQNIQVLAFRTFQQIFYGGPPSIQSFYALYFINQVVCFTTFFFIVICAVVGQYFLRILIGMNIKYVLDNIKYSNQGVCFLAILQVFKITNGLVHASFSFGSFKKILLLLLTQLTTLIAIMYFRKTFRLKSMFLLLMIEYILRVVTHIVILFRVLFIIDSPNYTNITDEVLGGIEVNIVWSIFGVAAAQLITAFFPQKTEVNHGIFISTTTISTKRPKKIIRMKPQSEEKQIKRRKKILKMNPNFQENKRKKIIKPRKMKTDREIDIKELNRINESKMKTMRKFASNTRMVTQTNEPLAVNISQITKL